ncbi:MAG: hypothetical protein ABR962_09965 [Candidatus Bathyarchaeia archaeon]|jgi:hypothetical protein
MSEINLEYLQKIVPKFREWLGTPEAKDFATDRTKKDFFFATYFNVTEIEKLDEGVLRDLVRILWSFGGWNNKDWLLDQMLLSGLPKIRESFKLLLDDKKPLAERFDQMREIKMMGAATISEMLAHHDHNNYPIYNRRAKSSLIKLDVNVNSLPRYAQITGSQYEDYVEVVKSVYNTIHQSFPEINDLLTLDFLLYYISITYEEAVLEKVFEAEEKPFDHDATILQVCNLGDSLGFDFQKEVTISSGCRVDAVWRSRVANLGMITYAFEVHKSGSRDSAILNLQRIFNADATVQKVVVVSSDSEIEKFRAEIANLHEDFRNSVGYFRIKDLQEALEHQEALKKILSTLGLLKARATDLT